MIITNMRFMEYEVKIIKIPLIKPMNAFGPEFVKRMDHSGLVLWLILHPEDIENGARPVGLEVNLLNLVESFTAVDDTNLMRHKPRVDLIFAKDQ